MWRSGAEGGAYLLNVNVSIRSGKRKHLLFIAKLEQKTRRCKLDGCEAPELELEAPNSKLRLFTQ